MLKVLARFASLVALGSIGLVGILFYRHVTASQAKLAALETRNTELRDVIVRLGVERRMAEFVVADQARVDGKLHSTLYMVEQDRAGNAMPARSFDVVGERVHLDALVIKFAADDLEKVDAPAHALLLLEKIYGDAQPPADAPRIDTPEHLPAVYRQADPKLAAAERPLWAQFWQMAADESLRRAYRVKVAHGAGVFVEPRPGVRYTVTLQADGNVTIYGEPLPGIFEGLLKRRPAG